MKTFPGYTLSTRDNTDDKEIMVSVFAIAYNHEPWITRALESLVMQKTNFPIEILVHDDASTDRTAEIIRKYEQKYPDLVKPVYQTKNQFSQGKFPGDFLVEKAKGKYLAICECDDYWTDQLKLQKQVDLLESHPECSMAVAKTDVHQLENGQFHYLKTFEGVDKDLLYFDDIFNGCYLHTSTFVIPKKNFTIYSKYRAKGFYGDTAFRYILLSIGPFIFLRETVSVYQITGKGIWTSLNRYAKAASHVKLFEKFYSHFDPKYKKYWAKNLVLNYMDMVSIDITKLRSENIAKNTMRMVYLGLRYAPLQMLKEISGYARRFIQKKRKAGLK